METLSGLSSIERSWIDWRWSWLSQRFGVEASRKAVVIKTVDEVLRDRAPLSKEDAESGFQAICKVMGFEGDGARLVIGTCHSPIGLFDPDGHVAAALQEGHLAAYLDPQMLNSPVECAALMIKQVVFAELARNQEPEAFGEDAIPLSELGAVFLGGGVILANAALVDVSGVDGMWSSWRVRRNAEMPIPMFGYALGRFAYQRQEDDPEWAAWLRPDIKKAFKRTIRHFQSEPPANPSASRPFPFPTIEHDAAPQEDETPIPPVMDEDIAQQSQQEDSIYCIKCGYNLTRLSSRECPECGSRFHPEDLNTVASEPPLRTPEIIKVVARIVRKIAQVVILLVVFLLFIFVLVMIYNELM